VHPTIEKDHRFLGAFARDVQLMLFLGLLAMLGRGVFIGYFSEQLQATSTWTDVLHSMFSGLRFDFKFAAVWILPLFLLNAVTAPLVQQRGWLPHLRLFWGVSAIFLIIYLQVVLAGYYQKFHDTFNQQLFDFIFDDTGAILVTLAKEYNLLPKLLGIALITALMSGLLYHWLKLSSVGFLDRLRGWKQAATVTLLLLLLIISARGSLVGRPAQWKDAAVTDDYFLNLATVNPELALYYALGVYQEMNSSKGLQNFLPDGDVQRAAQEYSGRAADHDDLIPYLTHTAKGNSNGKPSHIFLVVMESYHNWPMLPEYADLGIADGLKHIASQGIRVRRFLPASVSTMRSLSAIFTGLSNAGLLLNYEAGTGHPLPTSLTTLFEGLGYETNLFYGGYLSWQKLERFSINQGFDHIYGAGHFPGSQHSNEWGVDDELLFGFIEKTIQNNSPASVSVIMTTTNHPPFDLDVDAKGFPLKKIPDHYLEHLPAKFDAEKYRKELGHFWYADRLLESFVYKMHKRFPNALFAITGDHYGGNHISDQASLFERRSVPLVLFGPAILKDKSLPENQIGTHLDMLSTLVELSADKGHEYVSLGRDLLDAGTTEGIFAANSASAMTNDTLYFIQRNQWEPADTSKNKLKQMKHHHHLLQGLSWWMARHGTKLKSASTHHSQ
jgi:phosphoglycerol transferase MdoB-like AlkP superfamily enzyme